MCYERELLRKKRNVTHWFSWDGCWCYWRNVSTNVEPPFKHIRWTDLANLYGLMVWHLFQKNTGKSDNKLEDGIKCRLVSMVLSKTGLVKQSCFILGWITSLVDEINYIDVNYTGLWFTGAPIRINKLALNNLSKAHVKYIYNWLSDTS